MGASFYNHIFMYCFHIWQFRICLVFLFSASANIWIRCLHSDFNFQNVFCISFIITTHLVDLFYLPKSFSPQVYVLIAFSVLFTH